MSDYLGRECQFCDSDPEVWFKGPGGFCYGCKDHKSEAYHYANWEV